MILAPVLAEADGGDARWRMTIVLEWPCMHPWGSDGMMLPRTAPQSASQRTSIPDTKNTTDMLSALYFGASYPLELSMPTRAAAEKASEVDHLLSGLPAAMLGRKLLFLRSEETSKGTRDANRSSGKVPKAPSKAPSIFAWSAAERQHSTNPAATCTPSSVQGLAATRRRRGMIRAPGLAGPAAPRGARTPAHSKVNQEMIQVAR
jgi:hypothetical protein